MEVKFDVALQTTMEVFDYLITNDIFVFGTEDFKSAKITINENGFMLKTQIRRGVWEEKEDDNSSNIFKLQEPTDRIVPAIWVLKYLIKNVDKALSMYDIPSYKEDYAYLHDTASQYATKKNPRIYFKSYQELMNRFKAMRRANTTYQGTGGKVLDMALADELQKKFKSLSKLELRTIECYAKLEEKLESILRKIWISEFGDEKYIATERINWESIVEDIEFNYCPVLIEEDLKKMKMNGGYNPYISPLGLDNLTV